MKKVLYLDFNVGSGIKYIGDIFHSWLEKIKNIELVKIENQTQSQFLIDQLIEIKPDVIVFNEEYPRSVDVCFYYKKFNPNTKIVGIVHSYNRLETLKEKYSNVYEELRFHFNFEFYKSIVDKIFVLNHKSESLKINYETENKTSNYYFPVPPEDFKIKTEWKDRKKNFVYIGAFIYQKVSEKFLEIIKDHKDLHIDYYGSFDSFCQTEQYSKKFINSGINIIKKVRQEDVCDILNEYKYFILPHGDTEIFNITLLQAIMCGTIPLVSNDRKSSKNYKWIDWADQCYFGCNTEIELINNMKSIQNQNPDYSLVSESISKIIVDRVKYNEFKSIFKNIIESI